MKAFESMKFQELFANTSREVFLCMCAFPRGTEAEITERKDVQKICEGI